MAAPGSVARVLATPVATQEDLSLLSGAELAKRGFVRLPTSLEDALERLERSEAARQWFPGKFIDVYGRT